MNKTTPNLLQIVPGLALPENMGFLLRICKPIRYTKKAVDAGHLLLIDYHPPYIELECSDIETVIHEARLRKLRIYKGKHHITISDGVYSVRIYI